MNQHERRQLDRWIEEGKVDRSIAPTTRRRYESDGITSPRPPQGAEARRRYVKQQLALMARLLGGE